MEVPLHATGASKAVYANPPDWAEMQAWRRLLRPGDVFIDVGSNAGLYSVWAADCGATPIAVEPDPVNAERTRANLRLNEIDGVVHEFALGAEPGQMSSTTDADAENHLVTGSPVHPSEPWGSRTLDEVLAGRHARGVKVDVEGAERLVLAGAQAGLREQRIDVLQLEWNALSQELLGESRQPVSDALTGHGYVLCEPDSALAFTLGQTTPGPARDTDVFAVSPSMARELRLS